MGTHAWAWSVAATVAMMLPWSATAQPRVAYVHGSRVVLRAGPDTASPVMAHLTTNTVVELRREEVGRCEVRVPQTRAAGYTRCDLLGDRPLTLDDTARALVAPGITPARRLDWVSRAFWISPSLIRLIEAGAALETALLGRTTLEREYNTGRSGRYPHPEFEAMKARLSSVQVTAVAPRPASESDEAFFGFGEMSKRVELPAARPSFFRADEPLALVPLRPLGISDAVDDAPRLADALSAAERIPFRASRWSPDYSTHVGQIGTWDVSLVDVRFDRPATVHAVTATGRPTGYAVSALAMSIGARLCTAASVAVRGRPRDAGWRSAIVGWAGRPPPGAADVTSRVVEGATRWDRVVVHTIDLDQDGQPDVVRWSGVREPVVEHAARWAAVFANIGGTWTLAAYSEEPDCT